MEKNSKSPSIWLTTIFKKFDIGNHKISLSELGEILKALGSKTAEDELKRITLELGIDGDGSVDINEFKAIFCGGGDNKALMDAIDLFYKEKKRGRVSASQLHSALESRGKKFSLEECRRLIRSVDFDGYGYVNFEELLKKLGTRCGSRDGPARATARLKPKCSFKKKFK